MSSTSRLGAREAARHLLARVRVAREAGLDSLSFGDSHTRASVRYFQNTPTLGRALAEWDPARPAGCLFLLPMWPPVLVAEQVGTLAAFHDGPFIVQTGLGDQRAFARFGARVEHRGDALDESIRVIRGLFAGETVSSERFGVDAATIDLIPPDGVDWWIGTMSSAGVDRAARLGAVWYASHGAGGRLAALAERYRSACDQHGTEPRIAVRRDAIVLDDGERARALADQALSSGYRNMTRDMLIAGSPDDVAGELEPLRAAGIAEVVCRTMGVAPDVDLATIEGLGRVRSSVG
mgnify:CR=1 FL=1